MFSSSSVDIKKTVASVYLFALAFVVLLLVLAPNVVFFAFASYVLYVLLSSVSTWLNQKLSMPYLMALSASVFFILLLTALYWVYLGPIVFEQGSEIYEKLPELKNEFSKYLEPYVSNEQLKNQLSFENIKSSGLGEFVINKANRALVGLASFLTALIVVFITGIYFCVQPQIYREVIIKIFPKENRPRMNEILDTIYKGIAGWLIGRLSSMAIVGVITVVGLWFIGVDMAISLGVFSFIPNLGPIIALVPALAVGFLDSPFTALWVLILYVSIQALESYLITPFINNKAVSMLPAWLLVAQLLMGSLFGVLGVAFAAPILVTLTIVTIELFIKDCLKDEDLNSLV